MCRWWLLAISLALATSAPARAEPLDNPYRDCSRQTLDTAIAFERAGDREGLRDHVRSFGCKLIFPGEAFRLFDEPTPPRDGDRQPREPLPIVLSGARRNRRRRSSARLCWHRER